jgi:hypothetical protein
MSHDAAKVLMGIGASSDKKVSMYASDPATYTAGLAVRLKNDGTLSVTKAHGGLLGVSLGKSLSDHAKTSVAREGLKIPLRLELKRSTGVITVSSYANLVSGTDDSVTVGATIFTAQTGAATPGQATFQAATSNAATATSLAAQINAHATAGALVKAVADDDAVTLYAKTAGAATGHDVALAYTDNDANVGIVLSGLSAGKLTGGSNTVTSADVATVGAAVYINDATGKGDVAALGTISAAIYRTGTLTGLTESDTEIPAALIDMAGGL